MRQAHRRAWIQVLLLAALLLGAALRFYHLDAQSFWNDEGNSARLAERSVRLIIEGAAGDVHPPGYYLLLRIWRDLTGGSEFSLRSFSALCGVLTVAVTAALGRRAGGAWTAVGAACGLTLHPLAIYYSQEARMYALLGLIAAATVWIAAEIQRRRALFSPTLAGLVVVLTLGLYTHYAYVFVLLGVNVAFAATWLTHRPLRWRRSLIWAGCHALAALAFLPWLPHALRATGWTPPDLNTGQALIEMANALLVGLTLPADITPYWLPVTGALVLLALLTRSRAPFIKWAAVAIVLLPIALISGLDIYRAAYLKFLMVAVAPLLLLLALPLIAPSPARKRRHPPVVLAGALLLTLLPAQLTSLRHLYFDPVYARDDYRRLAAIIATEAGPDDAIILSAPNQWEVFTYYYDGPVTVYPAPYHPEVEKAETWTQEVLSVGHPQLFVLYWGDRESDPHRRLERELARQAYKATETWITDVRLARYGTAPLPASPQAVLGARVGEDLRLDGYSLVSTTYGPGEIVPVTLFWHAADAPDERFKVFVHVLDDNGTLVTQEDAEPMGGLHPTSAWEAGTSIVDRHGVLLPDDLAAGTYTLTTGMYHSDGTRLAVHGSVETEGNAIVLRNIEVE